MKKLMIAAAAAAMVGGAQAAECYDGGSCGVEAGKTAYTVSLSLKTTAPKTSKKKDHCDVCTTVCTWYNTQKTVKFAGIIWGDAECEGCQLIPDGSDMLLWDTTTKEQIEDPELTLVVGRYDKKGNKVEAYGNLVGDFGDINLAGFGSMYMKLKKATDCDAADCYSYVKNISGNAAGYLARPEVDDCDYIEYDCCAADPIEHAAASGTWKITYNASVAKKLAKGNDIASAYKVPAYVDDEATSTVTIEE